MVRKEIRVVEVDEQVEGASTPVHIAPNLQFGGALSSLTSLSLAASVTESPAPLLKQGLVQELLNVGIKGSDHTMPPPVGDNLVPLPHLQD